MAQFTIGNLVNSDLRIEGLYIPNGGSVITSRISKKLRDAKAAGQISISPDYTAAATNTLSAYVDGTTGAAIAPVNGTITFVTVSDTTTTKNALATIISELAKQQALNTVLLNRLAAIEDNRQDLEDRVAD